MTRTIFEQCGMRLRTDLPVDLLVADGEEYDVDASWGPDTDHSTQRPAGEVLAETLDVEGDPESFWYVLTRVEGGYCARFRDCGEFEISADVTDVRVRRDPNGRHELLPILLGGTVSAMLLGLRGSTVLHASAVSVDGTVMAFAGHSGQGKSTVAALMCLGGAELVTDDLLAIETGPIVRCRGGATELRLREPAAHLADVEPDGRRRATADGRTAFTPRSSSRGALPLGAIVVPSPDRTATELEVTRIPPMDALLGILGFSRITNWSEPTVVQRSFTTLAEVVNSVPLYRARIPWGPPFRSDTAPQLAALLTDPPGR